MHETGNYKSVSSAKHIYLFLYPLGDCCVQFYCILCKHEFTIAACNLLILMSLPFPFAATMKEAFAFVAYVVVAQ